MQINSLQKINLNNYFNKINNFVKPNKLERTPYTDMVCFTGKVAVKKYAKNTLNAVDFSQQIKQLPQISCENLQKLIKQNGHNVEVKPIEKLKELTPDAENYGAYYSSFLTENFSYEQNEMYVNTNKANNGTEQYNELIRDIAHEYTHTLQHNSPEMQNLIKMLAKGDYDSAKCLQGFAHFIFQPFDNELQAKSVIGVFNNAQDKFSLRNLGVILPREKNVSSKDILSSLGLQNEKQFKEFVINIFNRSFHEVFNYALADSEMNKVMPDKDKPLKLSAKIKEICRLKAQNEKEARQTESLIAKKELGTDASLNTDIYAIYYEMLEKAFS